jgi:hydrogenase maturation protease
MLPGPRNILVIGYGNDLRNDDAVGQRVAEAAAEWGVSHIRALAVHQLTPELAEHLAGALLAIFVDAVAGAQEEGVQARRIEPEIPETTIGHTGDPRALLALTQTLYGVCPEAWLITVPGVDFDLGERLSETAQRGMEEALRRIRQLAGV